LQLPVPALAGLVPQVAGGVYQAQDSGVLSGWLLGAWRAGCVLDAAAGDAEPPVFPFLGRAGHLAGVDEPVSAERAAAALPAEQVQRAAVERVPCLFRRYRQ
jgi:hypothetical protein